MAAPRGPKGSLNCRLTPERTRAIRAELARLYPHIPYGLKGSVAAALGFRGRWRLHCMRSFLRGRAWLFRAQFQRIEQVLNRTGGDPVRIARLARRFHSDLDPPRS